MIKKVYKSINKDNGKIIFYGSNREQQLYWNADFTRQYFVHYGTRYYLDDFMRVEQNAPDYMQEFDGYTNDSYFSGVVVKWGEEDFIKAFTFIS